MFRERMIVGDSLTALDDGYSIRARIPWYRALPISCLVQVDVALDGEPAAREAITTETGGIELTLDTSANVIDRTWYVLDDLIIRVRNGLTPRTGPHDVTLALGIRIPYLPINDEPLVVVERYRKSMTVKEFAA